MKELAGLIFLVALAAIALSRVPEGDTPFPDQNLISTETVVRVPICPEVGIEDPIVDLGQLVPLMGRTVRTDDIQVRLPLVSRESWLLFHVTPPVGESWRVTFFFRGDFESMGHYALSRASAEEETFLPCLVVAAEEAFSVTIDPTTELSARELIVTVQRIAAVDDTSRQPGVYGPKTVYTVPLTRVVYRD